MYVRFSNLFLGAVYITLKFSKDNDSFPYFKQLYTNLHSVLMSVGEPAKMFATYKRSFFFCFLLFFFRFFVVFLEPRFRPVYLHFPLYIIHSFNIFQLILLHNIQYKLIGICCYRHFKIISKSLNVNLFKKKRFLF
jgi:hypothetical protein